MKRIDPTTEERIVRLHSQGLNRNAIANAVKRSHPAVHAVLARNGLVPHRPAPKPVTKTAAMALDPTQAKRVERVLSKSGGRPYSVYVYDCGAKCGREVRVSSGGLYKATGKCSSCASRKRPFGALFGSLKACAKRHPGSTLTYDEFLSFTTEKLCHYCEGDVFWSEWSRAGGYSAAYHLDRKDNAKGYRKDNLVVCCTFCNMARGAKFTYDEFLLLAPALKLIRQRREGIK